MASRAMREGSVGLMIVGGVALFAVLVGWLRDVQIGRRAYQVTVEFIDARGVQVGTAVNYRGVQVGKVKAITPTSQRVDVVLDIGRLDILIPKQTRIEAQNSALLGETALDILPLTAAPEPGSVPGPLDKECDQEAILCDGSRLAGSTVADLTDLIRSLNEVAAVLNNPELLELIESVASNTLTATEGISELTGDLSVLSQSVQGEVGNLSTTLRTATNAARRAGQAATSVDVTAQQLSGVAGKASNLADRTIGLTDKASGLADQASGLANQASGLVDQASSLIEQNRSALNRALVNVGNAGSNVQTSLATLQPMLEKLSSREVVDNLAQLTENARLLTANLSKASALLGDPQNILLLQETLDSARVTFQNAQKLTSDLDEVTGDPEVRQNLRRLINGLSSLIVSTQQLEQQVTVAQALSKDSSPQQVQQLAQLNTEVNLVSLGLMRDLAQLHQTLELSSAANPASEVPSASQPSGPFEPSSPRQPAVQEAEGAALLLQPQATTEEPAQTSLVKSGSEGRPHPRRPGFVRPSPAIAE